MKTKLTPGQMIVKSLDSVGRTTDRKMFDAGIKGLKDLFGDTDDFFEVEQYLVGEGIPEDWASDIVFKHFE